MKFVADARGATTIEYAMMAGFIALVVVTAINALGQTVNTMFYAQIAAAL